MMAIGEKAERHYVREARMKITVRSSDVLEKKDSSGRNTYDLRTDVCVELSSQVSAILGLHKDFVTWSRLRKSTFTDIRWLSALSCIVYEFMHRDLCFNVGSILQMFRSNANSSLYRPYVHQIDRGADGQCCFHVHFMEELCVDYRTLSPQLGSLFTGMTLGVRFRHELLKQYRGELDNWVFRRQNCRDVIKDIWHTIEQIEHESNARGINDPYLFPMAFAQHRQEIRSMFDQWEGIRTQLVDLCSACESCERDKKDKKTRCERLNNMDKLLDTLWDMNGRFLFLTSARIHEVISGEV